MYMSASVCETSTFNLVIIHSFNKLLVNAYYEADPKLMLTLNILGGIYSQNTHCLGGVSLWLKVKNAMLQL